MNPNQQQAIVVIGGGYAGMMAAMNAAGRSHRSAAHVTLINPTDQFVERIRLHQIAAGLPVQRLNIRKLLRGTGIQFVQGKVTQIDPNGKTVRVENGSDSDVMRYDTLIYALGSTIDRDHTPGVREYADVLTGQDAARLYERLRHAAKGDRVIVCGGGLTGIEAATEIAEAYPHLRVNLLTSGVIAAGLSEKGRDHVRRVFKRLHIDLHEQTRVERITADTVMIDTGAVPYQVCVWAGAFSVPELARESGLAVNERGQIITDMHLRSVSHPSVYAAGDSAFPSAHPYPLRMACATAMPMGSAAGENAARGAMGKTLKPFGMAFAGVCISLGRRDAIMQFLNPDDSPQDKIIVGAAGTVVKEFIGQYTRWGLRAERWIPGAYWYPHVKVERDALATAAAQ